jgi:hypothetical protein
MKRIAIWLYWAGVAFGGLGWASLILMGYDCLSNLQENLVGKSPTNYCLAIAVTVPQLLLIPSTLLIAITMPWQSLKQLRLGFGLVVIPTLLLLTRLY